ncbi:MAG: hypothetical protein JW727_00400 [Candidatus Aenigmarchaeota archaeon]|nr:hypothetical protein [Candidatus Aenigmarchaeota archaeon]
MGEASFLEKYGPEILEVMREKRINVYDCSEFAGREDLTAEDTIRLGPAKNLEVGHRYVFLPDAANPADPPGVFAALERYAIQLQRRGPTVSCFGEDLPCIGFTPHETGITVTTECPFGLPYWMAASVLRTLPKFEA